MNSVSVAIVEGPLPPMRGDDALPADGVGARVVFEGIVRGIEAGHEIEALDYTAYEPMAQKMITLISEELIAKHGLSGMHTWHSRGRVPVGACSFRLVVASAHRKEALRAMDEFIDRLKKDVPIWKVVVQKAKEPRQATAP